MTETKVNEFIGNNKNAIIIGVTIVVLAIIFMFFWDRQQKRALEMKRLEAQTNVWEEWGPPQQNKQLNSTTGKDGGKIL